MTESKRPRTGSWWGRPGAPISLVLCITVAATIVLIGVLVIDPQPPCPPKCNGGEPPPTAVVVESEDLKAIARAVTAPQNLSITVKLDEEQLRDVVGAAREAMLRLGKFEDSATEIASGTRDIASNVKRVEDSAGNIAGKVDGVADSVKGIAGDTKDIADSVKRVEDSADNIASKVDGVADSVKGIADSVKRVEDSANNIASKVDGVADSVKGIAGDTKDIADSVKRVEDSADNIADKVNGVAGSVVHIVSDTKGIASGVRRIADKMGKKEILENFIGTVHFPHDSPQVSEGVECKWGESKNVTKSVNEDMRTIATDLRKKIEETDDSEEKQCVLVIGHANTLGNESYNKNLSEMRAKLVTECLRIDLNKYEFGFETKSTGEKENENNLHHPDSRYRAVEVYHYPKPCDSRPWEP